MYLTGELDCCSLRNIQYELLGLKGQTEKALLGTLHLGHIWAMDNLDARQVTVWGTFSYGYLGLMLGKKGSQFWLIVQDLCLRPRKLLYRV